MVGQTQHLTVELGDHKRAVASSPVLEDELDATILVMSR